MSSPSKRRDMDIMKLMMSDFKVHIPDDNMIHDFYVLFHGPKETFYDTGVWKLHVTLPMEYPFKSPSIGFINKMYHPNVDECSGSVCLDVINQTWSPMYDLVNIFDVFLPQLLRYPNPSDPLNGEAAAMLLRDEEGYKAKIQDYIQKYANASIIHFNVEEGKEDEITAEKNTNDDMIQDDHDDRKAGSSSSTTTTTTTTSPASSSVSGSGGSGSGFGLGSGSGSGSGRNSGSSNNDNINNDNTNNRRKMMNDDDTDENDNDSDKDMEYDSDVSQMSDL